MSKFDTSQITLIQRLYNIIESCFENSKMDQNGFEKIRSGYTRLIKNYGAQIRSVTRIIRTEIESPTIARNAYLSPETIKETDSTG